MTDPGSADQSRQRVERTITLIKLLSEANRPLTRGEIFSAMQSDYPDDSEATKRKFERDKKAIRFLMPISTTGDSEAGEDVGYWIDRSAMLESNLSLTAEEAAVVSIAIEQGYSAAEAARLQIDAAGLVSPSEHAGHARDYLNISPLPHQLQKLMRACVGRRRVEFMYKKPEDEHPVQRVVEVWGLIAHNGHWYAGGWDCAAAGVRVFRLDRIRSDVADCGAADRDLDPTFDISREVIREQSEVMHAKVLVRSGKCQSLRQRALVVDLGDSGWDDVTFDCRDIDAAAGLIARFSTDAQVLEPRELRDRVIERLTAAAGGDRG